MEHGRNKLARRCFSSLRRTSQHPIALMPTFDPLVGVVDGNGGSERIVWETLLEMKNADRRAGENDQGTTTAGD